MTTEATTPRHFTVDDIPAGFRRSADGIINDHGIRLLRMMEGAPRFKARLCEGNRWELGPGVTFHLDGTRVQEGETCDEAYAEAMFAFAVETFLHVVQRYVTVPMNDYQVAAYTVFAYNVGPENFQSSTVLRRINERRYDDAAEAMSAWVYATKGGHKQALRGLLRRQLATGCLAMGYDFTVACMADEDSDPISLTRERPPNNIGTDRILSKTKFTDILTVAQRYPLPPLDDELVLTQPASPRVPAVEAGQPVRLPNPAPAAPAPVNAKPSATVSGPAEAVPVAPTVPAPQPTPARPAPASVPAKVDTKPPEPPVPIGQQTSAVDGAKRSEEWSANTKAMWQSRRFYGLVLIMAGRLWMLKTGSNAFLGAVSDPLVMEFVGGFCVMIAGELVQSWGRAKAKRALH